ncbi:MAG: rRNA (cytosine1402-N4)-methyltransferase [Candidatus Atribacteria bacterium]|nr:rRNA (cytosine1402-N4)-methyltransferase [Candidatus Atribacteria bacterium]
MENQVYHQPVMVDEVCQYLLTAREGVYVDATLGDGGHALEILRRTSPRVVLVGIDRDPKAIKVSRERLQDFAPRMQIVQGRFSQLDEILRQMEIEKVNGVLFDLGVSTRQLEEAERGFSFQKEGRLDMRMDPETEKTAFLIVNFLPEKELADLIYQFGQERFSRRIARSIVFHRRQEKIDTTSKLARIVEKAVPTRRGRIHPATRTFMALRVAVNRELEELSQGLEKVSRLLAERGRVVVISYHSLEDRIVKHFFKNQPSFEILTPRPVQPSQEEVRKNRRARSARLRAAQKKTGKGGKDDG